jgi:hypothetical protein
MCEFGNFGAGVKVDATGADVTGAVNCNVAIVDVTVIVDFP